MLNSSDERDVFRLISRFANCFDIKAWDDLKSCLSESIYTDYSDLRGTPPEVLTAERFVELRREALQELRTHHLAGNYEIQLDGEDGTVRISMAIYRKDSSGEVFNTHCVYLLGVEKISGSWRISSIVQRVLWSDGTPIIHKGIIKD